MCLKTRISVREREQMINLLQKKNTTKFFFHFPLTPEIRVYLLLFLGFDEY